MRGFLVAPTFFVPQAKGMATGCYRLSGKPLNGFLKALPRITRASKTRTREGKDGKSPYEWFSIRACTREAKRVRRGQLLAACLGLGIGAGLIAIYLLGWPVGVALVCLVLGTTLILIGATSDG